MTPPYYSDDAVTLYHGDCLEVLAELPDRSVDSVCTDPPYGIRFMGKAWDGADIEARTQRGREVSPMPTGVGGPQGGYRSRAAEAGRYDLSANAAFGQWVQDWASECLRILKPGGYLVSFGGSRTWHRLAAGIEDAGFEIRDSIAWLYGSGFPKSLDVSKAIDKAAGAERTVVGTGRWAGRESANDLGIINDDSWQGGAPRVETAPSTAAAKQWQGWGTALKPAFEPIVVARKPLSGTVAATVLEHGTGALNIDACRVGDGSDSQGPRPDTEASATRRYGDRGSVSLTATPGPRGGSPDGRWPTNVLLDEDQAAELDQQSGVLKSGLMRAGTKRAERDGAIYGRLEGDATTRDTYADSGGASRFFPVFRYEAKAPTTERPAVNGVAHPTVKPLDLMRWLVRLVTPPGGIVLEPFAGSGTTAEACIHEHMRCIAIEREADYLPLITARLTKPIAVGFDFGAGA